MMSILPVIKGFFKKSKGGGGANDTVGNSLGSEVRTVEHTVVCSSLSRDRARCSVILEAIPFGKPPYDLAWYDEMSVPTAIYK